MAKITDASSDATGGVTRIAAHRAGAGLWPENSLTAFRNAFAMPVDYIEFDVHRSRDGVLVVHHDSRLGRTVEGDGAIADLDWSALREARVHGAPGERMPLLAEILPMFDGSPILPRLELKNDDRGGIYPQMTREVLTLLRSCGLLQRTMITSFDPIYLDEARAGGAREMLWLLDQEATDAMLADVTNFCRTALERGIGEIAVRGGHATPDLLERCRDSGMVLGAYAGKDLDFDRLLTLGLSAFTSDRPDLAIAARDAICTAAASAR